MALMTFNQSQFKILSIVISHYWLLPWEQQVNHVFFNLPWFPYKLISFQGLFAVNFIHLINQLYLYYIVLSVHFRGGGVIS